MTTNPTSTLSPDDQAKLDKFAETLKHGTPTDAPAPAPGIKTEPALAEALKKLGARDRTITTNLYVGIAVVVIAFVGGLFWAYLNIEEALADAAKRGEAKGAATISERFMKETPLNVSFGQGSVESYGFIRNYFFRTDKQKTFAFSATIRPDTETGNQTLVKPVISAKTGDGTIYSLKPGTTDVWILQPSAQIPPTPVSDTVVKK